MHVFWGILMVVCASLKSQFIIYRLMVARSKILWGRRVHRFHQITGVIVVVFGALVTLGYI